MRSRLVITTPADSLQILTLTELRAAAGLAEDDTSKDTDLAALGLRVAAAIAEECNIAVGAGGEPTLIEETVTETLWGVSTDAIYLSRRHNVDITSVVEDGTTLTADTHYMVDPESGRLDRFDSDCPRRWCASKVVVVYTAGFSPDAIPETLRQAAIETAAGLWTEAARDPYVKGQTVRVDDIEEIRTDYWSGSLPGQADGGLVPAAAAGNMKRYRNICVV